RWVGLGCRTADTQNARRRVAMRAMSSPGGRSGNADRMTVRARRGSARCRIACCPRPDTCIRSVHNVAWMGASYARWRATLVPMRHRREVWDDSARSRGWSCKACSRVVDLAAESGYIPRDEHRAERVEGSYRRAGRAPRRLWEVSLTCLGERRGF